MPVRYPGKNTQSQAAGTGAIGASRLGDPGRTGITAWIKRLTRLTRITVQIGRAGVLTRLAHPPTAAPPIVCTISARKSDNFAKIREEEARLRSGLISGELPLEGDQYVVEVEEKINQRLDLAAMRERVDPAIWSPYLIDKPSTYVNVRKRAHPSPPPSSAGRFVSPPTR